MHGPFFEYPSIKYSPPNIEYGDDSLVKPLSKDGKSI